MRLWMLGWMVLFSCSVIAAHAESFASLEWILNTPESKLDLAKAKLTIDHLIDPSSSIADTTKKLDAIVTTIRTTLPTKASNLDTLNALKKYLYEPGTWNSNQPYSYDFDDPFGHNIHNKLLSTYLATKRGNCVSMPSLFLVLGQKLGLNVSLSTAPEHLFIKFRDEAGKVVNLETTDKAGITADTSYQRQTQMTDQAIANGIYMQSLTRKEAVSVMMVSLMELYSQNNEQEKRIALTDLALKYYPKNIAAMINKGSAYGSMLEQEFLNKYPTPNQIPTQELDRFRELQHNTKMSYDNVLMLGYRPADQLRNANYMNRINQVKSTQH